MNITIHEIDHSIVGDKICYFKKMSKSGQIIDIGSLGGVGYGWIRVDTGGYR